MSQQDDSKNAKARLAAQTKAALRKELEQATEQFLHGGGEVNRVPRGATAWEPGARPPPTRPLFAQPPSERTPVSDVVATIEARRESIKEQRRPASKRRSTRVRRKVVYDDFGEPLRHIWVED